MTGKLPQVTHTYQNHHLDSTYWQGYIPRDTDVIISTAYKSGTTWMQLIMQYLVDTDVEYEKLSHFSPWLDARWNEIDEVIASLEAQTHQRVIKSHLALDGLPYFPQVKYIVVGRDGRDVFMSFWNHYSNYSSDMYESVNNPDGLVGDLLPRCPQDIHDLWQLWTTRGWFDWESEGYPFWGNLHHTQTYWDYKDLPNILFVHFNNLLSQPHQEIKRVADFAGIEATDKQIDFIAQETSFQNMKKKPENFVGQKRGFKGGATTFINKGTNGRWQGVLSDDELALYDAAVARVLMPDCAHWLATGQML